MEAAAAPADGLHAAADVAGHGEAPTHPPTSLCPPSLPNVRKIEAMATN
jgi:hypothetical protein